MKNLSDIKYNPSISFKQSKFYSPSYNSYYVLHKDYLGAYLKRINRTTTIDYKNSINIEINKELHNIKKVKVIYLPFMWENNPVILWTL